MNLKALLGISLAANLGLAYMVFTKPVPPAHPHDHPHHQQTQGAETSVAAAAAPLANSSAPGVATTNSPTKIFDWQSVESADYKEYIANLRAIGCPEQTIRDVIIADVNKMFDDKKKQARGGGKKFEYWKAGNALAMMGDPEELKKSREVDKERDATLKTLGIEPDFRTQVSSMLNPLETMFGFVPESKRADVLRIMTSMQEELGAAGGTLEGDDIMKAQREMEKKVKAMLTPEEGLQYDLRLSMTANMLRNQIAGFDPNEEEFLKVFNAKKAFDDQFNPLSRHNEKDEERQRREAAEKELNAKLKETLGEARYSDYERAQDYNFQSLMRAAKKGDFGTPQAVQAFEMKKMAEQKAAEIRVKNLQQAEREAALAAIRQETEMSLQNALGAKGWEEYNRPHNIHWLENIARANKPK